MIMKEKRLSDLLAQVNVTRIVGDSSTIIKDVTCDSRKIVSGGSLFVAVRGVNVDAHKFIPQVAQDGALLEPGLRIYSKR